MKLLKRMYLPQGKSTSHLSTGMSFILKNEHQTEGLQETTEQDVLVIAVNQFAGHG